jgi:hypothetical protein
MWQTDVGQHYDFDNTKVINFVPPDKLKEIIDFPLPAEGCGLTADLKGAHSSISLHVCVVLFGAHCSRLTHPIVIVATGVEKYLEQVLEYSVRTGSPRYFNQLWSGTDIACTFLYSRPLVSLSS